MREDSFPRSGRMLASALGAALLLVVAGILSAPSLAEDPPAGTEVAETLHAARQDFADRFTRLARRLARDRYLDLSVRALDRALEILPGDEAAREVREDVARLARNAARSGRVDREIEPPKELVGRGGSPRGWRLSGGTLSRAREAVLVESSGEPALAELAVRLPEESWEARLELRSVEGNPEAGFVFGSGRDGGIAVVRVGRTVVVRDEGGGEPVEIGSKGGLRAPRSEWGELRVAGSGRLLRVSWNGDLAARVELPRDLDGTVGVRVRGRVEIRRVALGATPAGQLAARAAKSLDRARPAEAVELFREASRLDPEDRSFHLAWAEAEEKLGRSTEAAAVLRGLVPSAESPDTGDPRRREEGRIVRERLERIEAASEEIERLEDDWRAVERGIAVRAFDRREYALADRLFAEVLRHRPDDAEAARYRLRVLSRLHGEDGWVPIDLEPGLEGWEILSGTPSVEDGVLVAKGGVDAAVELAREDLPEVSRFLIRASFRSAGQYEMGFLLGTGEERYRLVFRNVFREKNVTVEKTSGEVRFRRELESDAPSADDWHEFLALVDRNRLYARVDGKRLVDKVFPEPLSNRFGFFVARLSEGRFREPSIRFLVDPTSFRSTLAEWNVPDWIEIEAEEAFELDRYRGGTGRNFRAHAYNGRVLGEGWGGGADHFAEYGLETFGIEDARLHVRYAFGGEERTVRIRVDDGPSRSLPLPPPERGSDFAVAAIGIGDLLDGRHRVRIEAGEPARPVDLDRIVIAGPQIELGERSGLVESDRLQHFRIRVSPGVPLPLDEAFLFPMLEEVYDYMARYLGYDLETRLTLNLISRDCWSDPHLGGYATGDQLYVPMETATYDLPTLIHELSHCFDFGQGYFPPWMGEGKSVPILFDFLEDTGKRYLGRVRGGRDARSRAGRTSAARLMQGGETLIQYWGTERLPYGDSPLRGFAYDTSAFYFAELHRRYGRDWLGKFHALMRRDLESGAYFMPREDRVLANSVLIDYLSRSVGEDLRPLFEEWGFRVVDFHRTGEWLEADCGDEGEAYLTDGSGSSISDWGEEGHGRRSVEGGFVHAFPVASGVERLEVEIRYRGPLAIRSGDRFFEAPDSDTPRTWSETLEETGLWRESERLVVRAESRVEGEEIDVAWIRIRALR